MRRPPSVAAVLGAATGLWGFALGLRPLSDNSALTHLATGRVILDHGIPRTDPFSFTAAEHAWTVYSWLAAAAMAAADRLGGGDGIRLGRALLTGALALIAWRLTRPAHTLVGRIVTVTAFLFVGSSAWPERPLLPALVLMAALVLVVERDRGSPWLVAAGMWVWVNVHGSFPLALVYLVVRLAGRRLDQRPLGRLPLVLASAAAGALVGAVNPLGPRLLVFPLQLLARHDLLDRVVEWRSPNFGRPENLVFLVALLVALVLGARRSSFEDGLVAAVFGAAACVALRNLPVASVVITPILARGLRGIGSIRGDVRTPLTAVAMSAVVLTACMATVVAMRGPAYDLDRYPVRQLDWMQSRGLLDRRVATQDFVGNLIVARRGLRANVFFDDRFDLYPARVIRDAWLLLDGGPEWERRLDAYEIEVVLWERSLPLATLVAADTDWRVVRQDKDWTVAVRAEPATPASDDVRRNARAEAP